MIKSAANTPAAENAVVVVKKGAGAARNGNEIRKYNK
jgi:hypothetical protein